MRRAVVVMTVVAVLAALIPAASAGGGRGRGHGDRGGAKKHSAPKESACHANRHGEYRVLRIRPKALERHLGHGDHRPGDPVPDMDGYVFDHQCKPTPTDPDPEPETGTIVIIKDTVPTDPNDFSFTAGGLSPSTFDLDDDADPTLSDTQTFANVPPGTYTVEEAADAGYDTSVACTDPSGGTTTTANAATIDLAAGETVTCTFTNTLKQPTTGTIVIIKDTVPDAGFDFEFSAGVLTPSTFDLDDDDDPTLSNTQTFTNVPPGTYFVGESLPGGINPPYALSISCTDPDGGSTVSDDLASIDLDAGETVTCTFTNTALLGSIEIIKDTVPDDEQDFDFELDGGLLIDVPFQLDDDTDPTLQNSRLFSALAPGSYTVTETPVAGYTTSITCVDPDGGTTTSSSSATIDLDAGEDIVCTFTNTADPTGTIVIVKDAIPDTDQDFVFPLSAALGIPPFTLDDDDDPTLPNTATFADLAPGSYTVFEGLVTGYIISVSCDDPDGGTITGGPAATIDLDADETVTCTFVNRVSGLDIEKFTNGINGDSPAADDLPEIDPGDPVTWTYEVTHNGSIPVPGTSLIVADDQIGTVSGPASGDIGGDGILSPGETWVYEAAGTAIDLSNGTVPGCFDGGFAYENLGSLTLVGFGVVDTDVSHYCNPGEEG